MYCRLWVYFFLVTSITGNPSRHLAAVLAQSSESSSVVWSSPTPGDRFGPGDTIIGKWQARPQKVVSPSFRLCAGGENGCGATVWPEVKESAGSYLVSLAAPNVTTESAYYLQMKDDFGHAYSSPIFNLTPTPQNEHIPAAVPPDHVAQSSQSDQAPLSSSSFENGPNSNPVPAAAAPGAPAPSSPSDPGALSAPSSAAVSAHPGEPLVAAAHSAPPAAALAVPLSLAGAIILLAGGLALHHRRQLAAERERGRAKLARSDVAGLALDLGRTRIDSEGDVEKALFARRRAFPFPFPDRAADACYSHREEVAALEAACPHVPTYAYRRDGAPPEPRQRTRHLHLPPRLCNPGATRHPSSSYRGFGFFGSGSGSGGGGDVRRSGSLWRSTLSISTTSTTPRRSRRKPAPPSALTSPAMTESVTSVTSEVLPSYLPSPNFSSAAADRTHRREHKEPDTDDDFAFETVPLSPPPPPPLHTREEAAEPDDLRMRELRGVYEAVARALGSGRGDPG